jgi:beta-N-acetylhexosaminidase
MDELHRLAFAVLLPGLSRPALDAGVADLLGEGLGGLCLFGTAATAPREELHALLARAHGLAGQLVVAIDEEGGDVTRLHAATGSPSPGNAVLGAVDDPVATRRAALAIGAELAGLGITLDLGPVADVNAAADNPVIGVRSFSADPAVAARHTAAWVTGLQQAGVSACAKHFPGHGSTSSDSHLTLPVVPDDAATVAARDLPPFRAAVSAGTDAVMTSHLLLPRLDPELPATFSPTVLGLLRGDLGFTGTIVSDALDMAGASAGRGIPAAAVAALAAGVDLLCLSADTPADLVRAVQSAIVAAVRGRDLAEARLVEAAGRVARLHRLPAPDPDPLSEAEAVALAARAITITGELPDLAGAHLVQVDTPASIAVGNVSWGLDGGIVIDPADPSPGLARLCERNGRRVVLVQVRDATRCPGFDGIMAAMRVWGRPVVIDYGWPTPTPTPTVFTRGASAATTVALAALLRERGWRG